MSFMNSFASPVTKTQKMSLERYKLRCFTQGTIEASHKINKITDFFFIM